MRRRAYLAATAAVLITGAPALAASAAFSGKTSDGHAVSFRVSGSQINAFAIQTRFRCPKTGTFVARASYSGIKLTKGRFKATFANRTHSIRTVISGRIRGKRASGSIHRTAKFNSARKLDPNGRLTCRSDTSWSAKKR